MTHWRRFEIFSSFCTTERERASHLPDSFKMFRLVLALAAVLVFACCSNLAGLLPNPNALRPSNSIGLLESPAGAGPSTPASWTSAPQPSSGGTAVAPMPTSSNTPPGPSSTPSTSSAGTTLDPNADLDDFGPAPPSAQPARPDQQSTVAPNQHQHQQQQPNAQQPPGAGSNGSSSDQQQQQQQLTPPSADKNPGNQPTKQDGGGGGAGTKLGAAATGGSNLEWSILFYSVFIVYVSFVKLIYHNIQWIKDNMTEPGILMIFGIIWELIVRQLSANYDAYPRFNSRIFFYLFLPSTVLESASLLSNKWLFFNLLPILAHSIIGTMLFAISLGSTIYYLGQVNVFALQLAPSAQSLQQVGQAQQAALLAKVASGHSIGLVQQQQQHSLIAPSSSLPEKQVQQQQQQQQNQNQQQQPHQQKSHLASEQYSLNMTDCYVFATILASIDATPMLNVFKHYQVNEKLYYLVLGENLMNNAVVIIMFNLFLEHLDSTIKLGVVEAYLIVLKFFATLIGGLLIGLALAAFTLICVRLTRRFQVPDALSSYQNQCHAMVETLLILKLAYLTYTLANLAGTSSIVSLATFGILNDQYIKQNLNLRSQLTFRQVILATKTMGFSLVYPLLGMLLVEVATNGRIRNWPGSSVAHELATSGPGHSLGEHWNFKFLSTVALLTLGLRFLVVISLGLLGNLLTCGQAKIKFREQLLMAYGGLKGPLAIALLHRLLEHEELATGAAQRPAGAQRSAFVYTLLSITFISSALVGSFIRPLVARVQATLTVRATSADRLAEPRQLVKRHHSRQRLAAERTKSATILFDQVNYKITEYISHGLNSILGRSRSPYDKFAEFNETHMKPWLARAGSNTNWLSVFYDNLVLDETLNSNCFYVATEDPTTLRTFFAATTSSGQPAKRNQVRPLGEEARKQVGEKEEEEEEEHGEQIVNIKTTTNKTKANDNQLMQHVSPNTMARLRARLAESGAGSESAKRRLLHEFVLFNLKLENSRLRRRRQVGANSQGSAQPKGARRRPRQRQEQPARNMLSSTASSLLEGESNSTKQRHLAGLSEGLRAPGAGRRRREL